MGKSSLIIAKSERTYEQLKRLQSLPLEQKINLSLRRIDQFYRELDGKVYISFSGGKDSTVLLHLVRRIHPNVQAVFSDTGLEYPEIRQFVKTIDNVEWVKPEKPFNQIIKEIGYPVVSKEVSRYVEDLQNPTDKNERTRRIRLEGSSFKGGKPRTGKLPLKWRFLTDAPFKCSNKCCDYMKKKPFKKYEKKTGKSPYIGIMADEGRLRMQTWVKSGCNVFDNGRMQSRPLSFWTESDIWEYIKKYNLQYSKIYDMGYERTGCMFCMFGHWSSKKDRFEMMKKTHPIQYEYCMNKLGLKDVIEYINNGIGVTS